MSKTKTYWAAFVGNNLALTPVPVCKGYNPNGNTIYCPVLFDTKKQAKMEGWNDVRKVTVMEVKK